MEQKNFFIRAELCTGCGICQLACSLVKEKDANPARSRITVKRLVMDGLMFPQVCLNCKAPRCIEACRRKAIDKDVQTGWVTINKERCNDCTLCLGSCRFAGIVLMPDRKVQICDVCDGEPRCAAMCPTGAIQFASRTEGIAGSTDKAAVDVWE